MTVNNTNDVLYFSSDIGIFAIDLKSNNLHVVLENNTDACRHVEQVAAYEAGIVFTDAGSHQVKVKQPSLETTILAGTGQEGCFDGKAETARFRQPTGVCVELHKNVYICDSQTGHIKVITTIKGIITFLKNLGYLYSAFSIHVKHQPSAKLSLADAVENIRKIKEYLEQTVKNAQDICQITKSAGGPEGTISSQTVSSVIMLHSQMQALCELLQSVNPNFEPDLHTGLTMDLENFHALSHFKDQFPTISQYAKCLSNNVYESLKRTIPWSATYFTHPKSYYPVLEKSLSLYNIPKLGHLKPDNKLTPSQVIEMREWASMHGKAVKQRTVRQDNTKCRSGTIPLNMYQVSKIPTDKVEFALTTVEDV